jgi:hypothetical protein
VQLLKPSKANNAIPITVLGSSLVSIGLTKIFVHNLTADPRIGCAASGSHSRTAALEEIRDES